MPRWRRPTPEEMAVHERMMMRQAARPYAARAVMASAAVPDRVVREEGNPILLVGWQVTKDSSGGDVSAEMVGFGTVGGPIGQMVGNPTVTPELHRGL